MYRIEFIGLPGSGKSTIRQKLIQSLKNTDKDCYFLLEEAFMQVSKYKNDKIYRHILKLLPANIALKFTERIFNRSLAQFDSQNQFLANYFKSFKIFLDALDGLNFSINDRKNLISYFLQTGSIYEFIKDEFPAKKVILYDEGFVQKSLVFVSHDNKNVLNKASVFEFLQNIPLPDMVIYNRVKLELCYDRMLARPRGLTNRLANHDKILILNFFKSVELQLEEIISWLRDCCEVKIIDIKNDDSISNTLLYLENEIIRMNYEQDK